MRTAYRSNSNIRRTISVKLTQPQFDCMLEIFAVGEDHAAEAHVPERTREVAARAMDAITAAWERDGEAA